MNFPRRPTFPSQHTPDDGITRPAVSKQLVSGLNGAATHRRHSAAGWVAGDKHGPALAHPVVTVVVPAFEAALFIANTLGAIQAQTLSNFEAIVVDDGSSDATAEIVGRFVEEDARFSLVSQVNQGVASARNAGAARARGEFIAFCDADDWWEPYFLEKCVAQFRHSGPEVGVVYAWTEHHDPDGQTLDSWSVSQHEGRVRREMAIENFLANGSSAVVRGAAFHKAGGFNSRFAEEQAQGCEDWELYARLATSYEFRVVREPLVHYRRWPGSMSGNHERMARSHDLLVELVFDGHDDLTGADRRFAVSNFYMHLANEAFRADEPGECRRWLWRALLADFLGIARRRRLHELAGWSLFGLKPNPPVRSPTPVHGVSAGRTG